MHISRLDLNLFVVFDAIYSERSITRAAEVLHLTQPAVSHALNRLRESLGEELFLRSSRGMIPTSYSEQLIGSVRQALNQLQQGVRQGNLFDPARLESVFRISVRDIFEVMLAPPLVRQFAEQAPQASLNCMRIPREQLPHDLASGRIDLAADALFNHDDSICHEKLTEDRLVCLLRKDHPALQEEWSLPEMLQWRHVLVSAREHGPGFEDVQLSRHGLQRKIGLRTPHFFAAALVAAQSDLLLCAPYRFAKILLNSMSLEVKPFPITLPQLEIYLYWHRANDGEPAHQWLREQVRLGLKSIA